MVWAKVHNAPLTQFAILFGLVKSDLHQSWVLRRGLTCLTRRHHVMLLLISLVRCISSFEWHQVIAHLLVIYWWQGTRASGHHVSLWHRINTDGLDAHPRAWHSDSMSSNIAWGICGLMPPRFDFVMTHLPVWGITLLVNGIELSVVLSLVRPHVLGVNWTSHWVFNTANALLLTVNWCQVALYRHHIPCALAVGVSTLRQWHHVNLLI